MVKEMEILKNYTRLISSVDLSSDGQIIALGSYDNTVKLWNIRDNKEVAVFKESDGMFNIRTIKFSPNNTVLALGYGHEYFGDYCPIKIWNFQDGDKIKLLEGHFNNIESIAFSPDGMILASGSDDATVRLWDLTNGNEIISFKNHSDSVTAVAFTPDGTILVSGSADGTIKFWNVTERKEIMSLQGHSYNVHDVAFSPDGKMLVSAGYDRTIRLWNLDLDDLLVRGCNWLHDYLKYNPNLSDEDRTLCDDILNDRD